MGGAINITARWALTVCTLWALSGSLSWLSRWAGQPNAEGGVALLLGAVLFVSRAVQVERWAPEVQRLILPSWVAAGGVAAYVLFARILDVQLLAVASAGFAAYGLLGLWMDRRPWGALALPILLLGMALPAGDRVQGLLGVPARLWAAGATHTALNALGLSVASAETVLVLENGLADVAAPCSGLRGIWSALVVVLAGAGFERRALSARLGLVLLVTLGGLVMANAARVSVMVGVGLVAEAPQLAALIHEPLGLAGFAVVVGGALVLVHRWVPEGADGAMPAPPRPALAQTAAVGGALIAVGLAVSVGHSRNDRLPPEPVVLTLPETLGLEPVAPTEPERQLVGGNGGGTGWIQKYRFNHHDVSGQVLFVQASSWRRQHPPELCLRMSGFDIQSAGDAVVSASTPSFRLRTLTVGQGRLALYWYQSTAYAGPSLWKRVWSAWRGDASPWIMVSILLDPEWNPNTLPVETLMSIKHAVGRSLRPLTERR